MDLLLQMVAQAIAAQKDSMSGHGWQIERIYGGMNGITYQATRDEQSLLAIKVRKRDARGRAERDYQAMQVLSSMQPQLAPKPHSLHTGLDDIDGDVIITDWVDGTLMTDALPLSPTNRGIILQVFARLHGITRDDAPQITDAVLPTYSTADVIDEIDRRYQSLPDMPLGDITRADIGALFEAAKSRTPHLRIASHQARLIMCDTGISNFIKHDGHLQIVDMENAGFADPAYDIADFLVRPEMATLNAATRQQMIKRYASMMNEPQMIARVTAYYRLLLIFWLILTCYGFTTPGAQRYQGIRRFTLEQTLMQQRDYLRRIQDITKN